MEGVDRSYPGSVASEGAGTVEHRSPSAPGTDVIGRRVTSARVAPVQDPEHLHRPGSVVAEEFRLGRRWVQYVCACGEVLPWRQG